MTEAEGSKRSKIYCNHCRRVTNHQLAGEHCFGEGDREIDEYEEHIYRLWICAGCERGTLESGNTFLGGVYGQIDELGNQLWTQTFYPKRSHEDMTPKLFIKLKPKLTKIYRETIRMLQRCGTRTLLSRPESATRRRLR